jgi:hypothetical protein
LSYPVPGVKFDGRIGKSEDFASLKRHQFNQNLVAQKIARDKHLSAKRATWSSTVIIHDCAMAHINNAAPVLLGYQMYATFYNTSIEDDVVKSKYSMPITLHFATCDFSCPEIVFSSLPRRPPDGTITAFIILVFIGSIFSVMAIRTCLDITVYSLWKFLVAEIKVALRHTNKPIELPTANNHTCKMDTTKYLWHNGFRNLIKSFSLALCLSPTTIPTAIPRLTRAIMFQVHFFCLATRVLFGNAVFSHKFMIQRLSLIMRESIQLLREFFKHFQKILECNFMHTLNGFTTFAYSTLASVHENTMTSFDTDSSFWVCDNSATSHICNDRTLFIGNLVSLIYIVGAATGTLEPTLMGTVQLQITDDDGEKHTFTLTHVNYMPTSPVNLFSTCILSKQFTDENRINTHGTGIHSCYEDHTLIWDHGKYRKTFETHASRLPECLFSSGYSCLETYSTILHHITMMPLIGPSLQKQKIKTLLIQRMAM